MSSSFSGPYSTFRLICWAFLIALIAQMMLYASASKNTDNHFASVLFALSYLSLWILVFIAPFRPHSSFTLKGNLEARAWNTFIAIGTIALLMVLSYVVLFAAN